MPTSRRCSPLNRCQENSNHHGIGGRTRPCRLSLRHQKPQTWTVAPAAARGLPTASKLILLTPTNPHANWPNPSYPPMPPAPTRRPNSRPALPPGHRPDPHSGRNRNWLNRRSASDRAVSTQGSPKTDYELVRPAKYPARTICGIRKTTELSKSPVPAAEPPKGQIYCSAAWVSTSRLAQKSRLAVTRARCSAGSAPPPRIR